MSKKKKTLPKKKVVAKKVAKKKVVKKKATSKKKTAIKKTVSKTPEELFDNWWVKVAMKKATKIENQWVKDNEPNDPNEEEGGDHWHVNEMMHSGDACEMTYEVAKEIFIKGYKNEPWDMNQADSLYCDLDDIIADAYPAGKSAKK